MRAFLIVIWNRIWTAIVVFVFVVVAVDVEEAVKYNERTWTLNLAGPACSRSY